MTESIFEPVGDGLYVATEAALSPWSNQALHGGPPTMLMAREIERVPADQPMFVTRLTVELMRPVGRTPLAVRSRLVRPGRKVQLVEASLWNGEQEVARTTALRLRRAEVEVPIDSEPPPHGPPESVKGWTGGDRSGGVYHMLGVEGRSELDPGGTFGPRWAWFRLKVPLVPGEKPSGLLRICAAADFPNGISNVVDPRVTSYLNPDLTIYVQRLPVDEWVMVDARTWLERQGTGLAEGALYDRRGRIGRSLQSLLVEPRIGFAVDHGRAKDLFDSLARKATDEERYELRNARIGKATKRFIGDAIDRLLRHETTVLVLDGLDLGGDMLEHGFVERNVHCPTPISFASVKVLCGQRQGPSPPAF